MRISHIAAYLAVSVSAIHAISLPDTNAVASISNEPRSDILAPENALVKRKGGGGKGGGGGSSGGSKSGGGSSGSSGGSSGRTSSTSNQGGSTSAGSGPKRTFGGGGFYGGGSGTPYAAGKKTPKGLVAGALLAPALAFAILPGLWLWSVYPYYYSNPYRFYNASAINETNPNGTNQSLPVICLCQDFSVCGCDENDDQRYLNDLVGNGSYSALNKTLVTVSNVNGTQSLVINGTLPNGTTAPGGTDEGAAVRLAGGQYMGYWAMGLIVVYTVAFI